MKNLASALTGIHGEGIALSDVSVSAILHDLLSEVTVSQTYRNDEPINIEAVYTLPLPLDAVLLELRVQIGERVIQGVVVEKKVAEEEYEDAVAAGDSAVMLEMIEPGLYTMNVGNLLPKEKATITFTYAMLYRWAGDRLRFYLPTTIAPRFGASPHLPHQVPESSLTVENQFSLEVDVFGSLSEAQFECPSHAVKLAKSAGGVVISLRQTRAVMDRDFILTVKAPQAARSFVQCGADGDAVAAIASFQPFFPGLQQPRPVSLAIVIDCSGSMQGDSIEQAKQALEGILEALRPQDRVTLIAFGSSIKALSEQLLPCDATNLADAKRFAKQLEADMGGTQIGNALHAAYSAVSASESADIFLVTDGEVSSWETVIQDARRCGHRIFTVGVGSAVSEAFVRGLASSTGGECELVSPREGMADRVVRHFERMRSPRAKRVVIHWPHGSVDVASSQVGAVFEGDTVIASARFDQPSISGTVALEVETETGELVRHELPIAMTPLSESADRISTVARLAAAARLKESDEGVGLPTALRYRLLSPWTNWLVTATRSEHEKAYEVPALRKVKQTLAAGWGGVGSVLACMSIGSAEPALLSRSRIHRMSVGDFGSIVTAGPSAGEHSDLPEPYRRLLALIEDDPSRLDESHALDLLTEAGLASEFHDLFSHGAELGLNVGVIAAIVLAEILGGPLGVKLSTQASAAIPALRDYARQVTEGLRQIAERGIELAGVIRDAGGREAFRQESARDISGVIDRIARIRDLLEHLRDCVRRSADIVKNASSKRGGAIA